MKLTPEQVEAVRKLAASGASISDIQSALATDFNIHLNYLDTRFLLLDLDVTIAERNPPKAAAPQTDPNPPLPDPNAFEDAPQEDFSEPDATPMSPADDASPLAEPPAPAGGSVQVEISRIQRPGYALSGTIVCSDGVKGEWGVLNDGRLALDFGEDKSYRPSPEDIQAFQRQLRDLLSNAY